jgi:hypothetical protein
LGRPVRDALELAPERRSPRERERQVGDLRPVAHGCEPCVPVRRLPAARDRERLDGRPAEPLGERRRIARASQLGHAAAEFDPRQRGRPKARQRQPGALGPARIRARFEILDELSRPLGLARNA